MKKPKKPTDAELVPSLFADRERFIECRATIARNTLELFKIAERAEARTPGSAPVFLRDCGVAEEDLSAFSGFDQALGSYTALLRKSHVDFGVVKALLDADEETRSAVMNLIESGAAVGVQTVERISSDRRRGHHYSDKEFLTGGAFAMRTATLRAEQSLKEKCFRLHPLLSDDQEEISDDAACLAQETLIEFERMFGTKHASIEDWMHLALEDQTASYIAQAYYVLNLAANREAGAFYIFTGSHLWCGLDALAFLAGIEWSGLNYNVLRDPRHLSKLTAIEICAGGGGMTIGLESANFSILALNEMNSEYARSIRTNRPDLAPKLMVADIRDTGTLRMIEKCASGVQVDLIAGALPTEPFAANGNKGGDKSQVLSSAILLVHRIRPKAFVFEVHESFESRRHIEYRQKRFRYLDKLGYAFGIFSFNTKDHGVPQDREQTFFIGLQKPYWSRFKAPGVSGKFELDLQGALRDIPFPNRSSYSLDLEWGSISLGGSAPAPIDRKQENFDECPVSGRKEFERDIWRAVQEHRITRMNSETPEIAPVPNDRKQKTFDEWPFHWKKEFGHALAPDVRQLRTSKMDVDKWSERGLSTILTSHHATADTLTSRLMPIPLTLQVLKGLQGIPNEWELSGKTAADKERQILNMTPPRLALAIGRAIHAAITGEEVSPAHERAQIIDSGKQLSSTAQYLRRRKSSTSERARADIWRKAIKEALSHEALLNPV